MNLPLILLALFYVLSPIVILHLCHRFPFVNKLGAVIIAYIVGLLLGNTGILPGLGSYLNDFMLLNPKATSTEIETLLSSGFITESEYLGFMIYKLRDLLMSITILLAIPLILFSANVKQWGQMAGKTLLSLFVGFFAVLFVVILGYFIFDGKGMTDLWKVSGLLIGVYTGGTPNLASLKMMLDVDANTYILTHTYDLIIGVFYLTFLMTIGQKMFHRFLPKYPLQLEDVKIRDLDGKDPFWGIFQRVVFVPLLKAYALAIAILAIGGALSMLVPERMLMVVVILTITTLGILASMIPSLNRIEKTFESGMYLILIFSIVVASMADVTNFKGITPGLFAYITMAVFGSLFLHVLLSRFLKIDADTVMITSTAMICSPPFVPVVAGAIKNKEVILPGLTIGIIGYAVGNYLGFLIANILKGM
ncbi:MAG: hypothetical protein CVT92_01705 [Bacteroidetes bacterium HGW-Bacteroidetes-1]|nr:MAG: hypothetical protein CVT92_01705 [Bacteroidetes bacterium HGW-Bacteroidetes-1]